MEHYFCPCPDLSGILNDRQDASPDLSAGVKGRFAMKNALQLLVEFERHVIRCGFLEQGKLRLKFVGRWREFYHHAPRFKPY